MKISSLLSGTALLSLGLIISISEKTSAQIKYGPNITVSPQRCRVENRDCQAERFRENTRHNRQI